MTTSLLDLGNLWASFDLILQFLPTKDLALFANVSKKSLTFVQDFFKTIKKSHENSHYGFICTGADAAGGAGVQFKLPHEKCLLKIWEDKGQIYDHVTHRNSNEFFKSGYSYQFANNAIIQITKIIQRSESVIKVHGWVLSGSGTFKMVDKQGKRYFRPYPIWSYITVDTYKRFKILPGLVRAI